MIKKKFKVNKLQFLADQLSEEIVEPEELKQTDRTKEFFDELEIMIKNGELIKININAKVRLGKSTVAMAIGKEIFELLKKYNHRKKTEQFCLRENVVRDQQEYSKRLRDANVNFTVLVVDENNELEERS